MNSTVDPVTTQVIRNALVSAAEEMRAALVKTAFNPLIYEVQDFAVALLSRRGELLAQGASLPLFIACLPAVIQNGLAKHGDDGFLPGDVILANDPYSTGTHVSDVAVYMPIFFDGQLRAFSANMAHWADVGGKSPGGWCPDSLDVFQEGMLTPHVKLYENGRLNEALKDCLLANTRFPDLVEGDMGAQIAACRTGANRYLSLCEKYGAGAVRQAMETVFDQSEALMRRLIRQMPKGRWTVHSCLDHDGVERGKTRKIQLSVEVGEDEITVDFAGTDPAAKGPINIPLPAARAAAEIALKSATAPHEPANAGHSRPLNVVSPPNALTNPSRPTPCDSYGYAALVIIDLVSEALANAVPERCPAGEYMLFGGWFFRQASEHGDPFILIDPITGGGGALPFDDGADGLIFHGDGDAPNTPVEVLENRYPVRVDRYQLHAEEYGIGKYRGGLGTIRDYRVMTEDVLIQIANEQTVCRPHGLFGGRNGGVNRLWAWAGTERQQILTDRVSFFGPFGTGDVVSCRTAGGAGYGDPLQRDPERVRFEVLNELLTPQQAEEFYGVILEFDADGDPTVDWEATRVCRTASSQ